MDFDTFETVDPRRSQRWRMGLRTRQGQWVFQPAERRAQTQSHAPSSTGWTLTRLRRWIRGARSGGGWVFGPVKVSGFSNPLSVAPKHNRTRHPPPDGL